MPADSGPSRPVTRRTSSPAELREDPGLAPTVPPEAAHNVGLPPNAISVDALMKWLMVVVGTFGGGGALYAGGAEFMAAFLMALSAHKMLTFVSSLCMSGVAVQVVTLVASSAHLNYRRVRTHRLISKKIDDSVVHDSDSDDDADSSNRRTSPRTRRMETYKKQEDAMAQSMGNMTQSAAEQCAWLTFGACVFRIIASGFLYLDSKDPIVMCASPHPLVLCTLVPSPLCPLPYSRHRHSDAPVSAAPSFLEPSPGQRQCTTAACLFSRADDDDNDCLDDDEAYNYILDVGRMATWATRRRSAACCGLGRNTKGCLNVTVVRATLECMYGTEIGTFLDA